MVGFIKTIMALAFTGIASVLSSPLSARDLDKPVIDTPLEPQNTTLSRMMLQDLQSTSKTIQSTNWTVRICYDCQVKFQQLGYDVNDTMQLYNVTYADCNSDDPWIMCRHKDSPLSIDDLANYISHIPLNMRKYLRHIMNFPPPTTPIQLPALNATVDIDEGNLILHGAVPFQAVLAAAARVFADHGLPTPKSKPYWESDAWLNAYNKDSALVNTEAKKSQEENLKQMTVLAVYDKQRPGLRDGKVVPEWKKFENMLRQIEKDSMPGGLMKNGETSCVGKVANDRPGSME